MIFSEDVQKILAEWVLDFKHSPIRSMPMDETPVKQLQHAASGKDVSMMGASVITEVALSNEGSPAPTDRSIFSIRAHKELKLEGSAVLAELRQHYHIDLCEGQHLRMSRRVH